MGSEQIGKGKGKNHFSGGKATIAKSCNKKKCGFEYAKKLM